MGKNISESVPVKRVSHFYFFIKRLFDVVSATLLFLLILPLFLLLGFLVIATSKGKMFFKDRRVGKGGKDILVLKFRTMYSDSETNPEKYLTPAQLLQWKTERKVKDDPRITPLGRFLRKSSLDELPQLINIIGGSMSVVGPRAVTRVEIEKNYTKEQQQLLLSAIPGLTGYWQVYGRGDANYETGERARMELYYFSKRSLAFDFFLIFATIPAVLKHRGAQ